MHQTSNTFLTVALLKHQNSHWAMTGGIASKLLIIMTWACQHSPGIPALNWRGKFKARPCNEFQTSLSCIVRTYSKMSMYVCTYIWIYLPTDIQIYGHFSFMLCTHSTQARKGGGLQSLEKFSATFFHDIQAH